MNIISRRVSGGLAGALLAAAGSAAMGNLLVYEGFNYTAGANALNGKNGGTGYSAAYTTNNNADVVAGSFDYTDANGRQLVTGGNRAWMDSTSTTDPTVNGTSIAPNRSLNTSPFATLANGPLYVSFMGKQTAGDQRDVTVALFVSTPNDPNASTGTINSTQERLSIGHGNPSAAGASDGNVNWGAYTNAVGQLGAYSSTPATTQSLVVARIDLNVDGDLDRFRIYVNPTLGNEPAVADAESSAYNFLTSLGEINRVRMRAGGSSAALNLVASQAEFDEIRIGTNYWDVTPMVPAAVGGDANYNGRIDADDYVAIDRGYARGLGGYVNGDFNGDGAVTSADYLIIDQSFQAQGGTLSADLLAAREAAFGPGYVDALTAAPEPAVGGLAVLGLLASGRRARRS